jgi:uncharacterized protein with GYD domain
MRKLPGEVYRQGIRNAKDSPKRAEAFKQMAKTFGANGLFWTQGRYDIVTIVEAPDEISATALNLSVSALEATSALNHCELSRQQK